MDMQGPPSGNRVSRSGRTPALPEVGGASRSKHRQMRATLAPLIPPPPALSVSADIVPSPTPEIGRFEAVMAEFDRRARFDFGVGGVVTPRSTAAVRLLASSPAATRVLLDGIRDAATMLAPSGSVADLRSLSLSTTVAGWAANRAMTMRDLGLASSEEAVVRVATSEAARASGSRTVTATYQGGHIDLAPDLSTVLGAHLLRDAGAAPVAPGAALWAGYVLAHELSHGVTPDQPHHSPGVVEEGIAETIARLPGVAADVARRVGLPAPPEPRAWDQIAEQRGLGIGTMHVYDEAVAAARSALTVSGIAHDDPAARHDVVRFLQAGSQPGASPGGADSRPDADGAT